MKNLKIYQQKLNKGGILTMEEKEKNINNNPSKESKIEQQPQNVEKKIKEINDIEKFSQNNVNHLDIVNKLKELEGKKSNEDN